MSTCDYRHLIFDRYKTYTREKAASSTKGAGETKVSTCRGMKLDLAENSLRQDKALSVKAETQRLPEEKVGSAL